MSIVPGTGFGSYVGVVQTGSVDRIIVIQNFQELLKERVR